MSGLAAVVDEFVRPRSDAVDDADAAAAPAVAAVETIAEHSVAITPGRKGCITSDSPSAMQRARKKTQNILTDSSFPSVSLCDVRASAGDYNICDDNVNKHLESSSLRNIAMFEKCHSVTSGRLLAESSPCTDPRHITAHLKIATMLFSPPSFPTSSIIMDR